MPRINHEGSIRGVWLEDKVISTYRYVGEFKMSSFEHKNHNLKTVDNSPDETGFKLTSKARTPTEEKIVIKTQGPHHKHHADVVSRSQIKFGL